MVLEQLSQVRVLMLELFQLLKHLTQLQLVEEVPLKVLQLVLLMLKIIMVQIQYFQLLHQQVVVEEDLIITVDQIHLTLVVLMVVQEEEAVLVDLLQVVDLLEEQEIHLL